jgi:predicted PurR-regulated permease PerM
MMEAVPTEDGVPLRRDLARTAAITSLTVVAVVAVAFLLWNLVPVLLLIFGGALFAILFRALAEWTAHWTKLSYRVSLGLVIFLLLAVVVAGLLVGGQVVANQMAELAEQVPKSLEKLREQLSQLPWGKRIVEAAPKSMEELPVNQAEATSYAAGALYSVTGLLAGGLLVLFLAIYLSINPQTYVDGLVRLAPVDKRPRLHEVMGEMHDTLRWWLLGKILSMAIVGIATTAGLAMLGVPLAVALGVIAALLTFVPNFGPILSAAPAVLLAFVQSPTAALYVVILYLAIQTVESYLITPLIQQRTVALPPALTISAQIALGVLVGPAGVILATPLAAAALVAVTQLYVKDVLEASPN